MCLGGKGFVLGGRKKYVYVLADGSRSCFVRELVVVCSRGRRKNKRKRGRMKGTREGREDIRVELSSPPACVRSYLRTGYNVGQSLGWIQQVWMSRCETENRGWMGDDGVASPPSGVIVVCLFAVILLPYSRGQATSVFSRVSSEGKCHAAASNSSRYASRGGFVGVGEGEWAHRCSERGKQP